MRILRVFWARVRGVFAGSTADAEMREEFESHVAMHIDENIRRGMSPDEARRDALIAAGGLTFAAEAVRERRGLPWVENLVGDVRYATRTLLLNRGYSLAVILTVALGIGANAAMFTIINAVVLRPLPYPDPDRLVAISLKDKTEDMGVVGNRTYAEWERSAKSVSIATSMPASELFTLGGETESVDGRNATAGYFRVMDVLPRLGRAYAADEDTPNGPNVIVLSEQFWRRRLAADSAVIGKVLTVDGKPTTVVGVMPASYTTDHGPQFWLPFRMAPPSPGSTRYFMVTARLRDGVSIDAARAELATIEKSLEEHEPLDGFERKKPDPLMPVVRTLHDSRYGDAQKPLLLLFGAVGVLLLIACANLANLSLARAARREREFVVRLALGASRWRLARHVLSESLLLSLVGSGVGLALSTFAVRYFVRLSPKSVGRVEGIHIDGRVLLFTLVAAVATGLVFGLVPARVIGRGRLVEALSSGSPRAAGTLRQRWIRRVLVVTQLATALMLITGAGVVARTFWRVTALDVGFRPDHLLFARVTLPRTRYNEKTAPPLFDELLARIQREPGVEHAAFTDALPMEGIAGSVSSTDSSGKSTPRVDLAHVGPGYLQTLGARLVAGRLIDATDRDSASVSAVITETTARLLFPEGGAVGRRLPFRGMTVVGIVKDIRQRELEAVPGPIMYLPLAHRGGSTRLALAIRTTGNPALLEAAVHRAVRAIDPALPPPTFVTMEEKLAETVAPRRFAFVLLALFALIAGSLAVIGLYGVLAYLVADRTREIGIRIALGADVSRVRRLVIGQGMALVVFGIVAGIVGSGLAAKTMTTMVYEVSVYDPRAFVAGTVLLGVVAYLACYIPARRASKVDPILALRAE